MPLDDITHIPTRSTFHSPDGSPTPPGPGPTPPPAGPPNSGQFCGTTWTDAGTCRQECPGGVNSECPAGESCFADVPCP